jgi:hypothetical protein
MIGITRGFSTLVGAAVAGFLIWLATQIGSDTQGEYWATYGVLAAAGLTMALSQILGGWTKWGWPRLSAGVFLLGFLPVLVAGGWVLLARQPADFFNTSNWSRDLGITFGFCFDTSGRRDEVVVADDRDRVVPVERAEDEPLTAEREEWVDESERERLDIGRRPVSIRRDDDGR